MRVLLVRPPRIKKAITIGEFMFCEPIGLEIVCAILKPDHTVRILDMMVDEVDIAEECAQWKPDVVGLTSLCVDVGNVLDIVRQIKAHHPRITTLVGGTQTLVEPSAFHHDAIDHVIQYTTAQTLRQLFQTLKTAEPLPLIDGIESRENEFASTGVKGRNEYIVPDIESTATYRKHYSYFGYKPCAIMQTSQGCSKQCKFCLRWRIEGGKEHPQNMDIVFEQIKRIKEPNIMIFDNDFLCDGDRLNTLCDLLEAHNIKKTFLCYGSVNGILKNRTAIARFAQNGLSAILVGYESFNPAELQQYAKKSTTDDNHKAARFLKEIHVDAWASFIMNPDWSVADFKKFRRTIRQLRPEISSMTPLTPFPALPLYEEYADRRLIDRTDYDKWNFGTVSIMPSQMSLRHYYFQILLSNLYVNLFMNNTAYLIKKFGPATLFRLLAGSLRLMNRYIVLMLRRNATATVTSPCKPSFAE